MPKNIKGNETLNDMKDDKRVPSVPEIFRHSTASTIFHVLDLPRRSHPLLQGNNTSCRGLP